MKPKCFFFLVLLGFGLTVSCLDESNVKSYYVERRKGNHPDLFVVDMTSGSRCVSCSSLNAFHQPTLWFQSPCVCACSSDNSTFIPSLRFCISRKTLPANFTDCPSKRYENVAYGEPLNFPVDLHMKGNWKTSYSSSKSCKLYGYYLDYTGFQVRWRKINVSVFQLIKEGGTGKTFSIQKLVSRDLFFIFRIVHEVFCFGLKTVLPPS
ncbi:uncharacterized protein LOC111343358 [Stylophora pistillata]|uniref:uncharacterized protein LOC111343358 n=1 Tax=Stylophora pistillata TaxID=50429 RepID=UPI000C050EF8|nr:uncharacterized protein LOC111343358 [Stylophora pistillata]